MHKYIIGISILLLLTISGIWAQQRTIRPVGKDGVLPEVPYRSMWALLIGINDYPNLPVQYQLHYALNDVKELRQVLIDQYQFLESNVVTLTDGAATYQNIKENLGQLSNTNKVGKDDCVLIYFSGHGQTVPLPRGGDMGFILPHDASVDMDNLTDPSSYYSTCLPMYELKRLARMIPAKHVLFLIDACYSGLAVSGKGRLQQSIPGYLRKVASIPVQQIITAGGKGDQSYENPDWGHGAFTYKLLEALRTGVADHNEDGVITALELASHLRSVVPNISPRQTPQYGYFAGEGEFLFWSPPKFGILEVQSIPEDAIVSVIGNGRVIRSRAPVELDVYPGQYTVELEHESYMDQSREVVIRGGQTTSVSVQLSPNFGVLDIQVTPAESQILINGIGTGETPAKVKFPPGTYKVEVRRDRFLPMLWEEVELNREQTVTMMGALQAQTGMLLIKSEPPGTEIAIDGNPHGTTPRILQLPIGSHALKLSRLNYQDYEADITITMDEATEHFAELSLAPYMGKDGALMVLIPEGEFQMGGNNVRPVETVYLDAFYMDKYAVSNAQYKKFIDATGHRTPGFWNDPNYNVPNRPVVGVNWHDAAAYAEWAGKRLPTDAEWEKAARGGLSRKLYPWGDGPPNGTQCNFADRNTDWDFSSSNIDDGYKYTAPVDAYSANGYGLFNMVGNVWEWCADWHDKDYHKRSPYKRATKHNPTGPISGEERVLRGGSWAWNITTMRITSRWAATPDRNINLIGFRCVKDIPR